jgi:hypothetical protein
MSPMWIFAARSAKEHGAMICAGSRLRQITAWIGTRL